MAGQLAPNNLVRILSISCVSLTLLYMVLMVTTVFFAAWQTQAVNSVRNTESAIGNLEANYYTTMNQIDHINPTTVGYVTPSNVKYVAEARDRSAGLSFNGN